MSNPACPKCGAETKLINGRNGSFYGCTQYQTTGCRGGVNADQAQPAAGRQSGVSSRELAATIASGIIQALTPQHTTDSQTRPDWGDLPEIDQVAYHAKLYTEAIIRELEGQ